MNAEPHTVTVPVLVVKALEVDEPDWCTDPHASPQFKPGIVHTGAECAARFDTGDDVIRYLQAWLTTAPYGADPQPLPLVAVDLGADIATFAPDRLREFTAITRLHLDHLDALADEAERLRGGGQ
ncbi:hypothetical protein SALBM135S_00869 [Streptomyces alboniger]